MPYANIDKIFFRKENVLKKNRYVYDYVNQLVMVGSAWDAGSSKTRTGEDVTVALILAGGATDVGEYRQDRKWPWLSLTTAEDSNQGRTE